MLPRRPLVVAVLLASLALAGCGSRNPSTTSASSSAPASAPSTTSTASTATTAGPTTTTPPTTARPPSDALACGATRGWGTGAKQRAASSTGALYRVRAGQHDCYERVVFDINDPAAVGYSVRYVDLVREDGSGAPRPVAGSAALEVIVRAPAQGLDSQGHQPGRILAKPGQDFYTAAQLAAWRSLRQVRYAGSFEGQTTFAVGVRARVPFRVLTLLDSRNQIMRVVLDVAR